MEDLAEKPKYLDGKAILTAIAIQQGIFVERAEDIYSFSHLTVQEYLTAQFLSQNPTILEKTIAKYLTEQRWREVFLLVLGLLQKADDLLKQMATIAQQRVNLPTLQGLLTWANQITIESSNLCPTPTKRIIVIFYALTLARASTHNSDLERASASAFNFASSFSSNFASDLNLASDLDRDLASARALALNLANTNTLDLTEIFSHSVILPDLVQGLEALKPYEPDCNQPYEAHKAFLERLLKVWYNGLNLDHNLVNLSKNELQALADYFYICELIVRCKESAVRVSRDVWESIENAMVMPTPDAEL